MIDRPTAAVRDHPRLREMGRTHREQLRIQDFAEDLAWWLYTGQREGLGALARVVTVVAARELREGQRICHDRPLLSIEAAARATEHLWPWLRRPPKPIAEPEPEPETPDIDAEESDPSEPPNEGGEEGEDDDDDGDGEDGEEGEDDDDDEDGEDADDGDGEDGEEDGEDGDEGDEGDEGDDGDDGEEDGDEDDEDDDENEEDGDENEEDGDDGKDADDEDEDKEGDENADGEPDETGEPDPLSQLQQLLDGTPGGDELDGLAARLGDAADAPLRAGQLLGRPAAQALQGAMDAAKGLGHLERFLPGVGWSLAPGRIQQIALQRLDVFVQLLDRMPELEAIAEMLGRLEEADRREGTQDGGNEEVVGVHFSGEVRHALPSELGLLAAPDTEDLFYTRWTEHRLVSLELSGAGLDGSGEGTTRGPFIVCLDASASMDGPPELASKALVLALCRRVLPQGRAVHVLMFGGRGQHVEVRIRRGRTALDGLLDVLTQSFDGGTDFDGPLLKALDMLQDQELHRSDILVVTDGYAVTAPYVNLRVQQVREALGLSVVTIIMGAGPTDGVHGFSDEVWRLTPSKLDGALGLLRNV